MVSSVTVHPTTADGSSAPTPATNAAELCSAMPGSYLVRYSGAMGAQTSDAHEGEPRMNNHTSASFVPSMGPERCSRWPSQSAAR
jgi:hypothetical protein